MGRLPTMWAGRAITDRVPYEFSGELSMTTGSIGPTQYPDMTFGNSVDKPFEIHRMIPRVYALDSDSVLLTTQPDQELLQGLVRIHIDATALNQIVTKDPTLLGLLTKGSSERTWEWADPLYLIRSQQLIVSATTLTFPAISGLSTLRIAICFEGFMCVVAPPTGNR